MEQVPGRNDWATYQAASDEQHCNGDVFQILRGPFPAPATQVLKKDIRDAVQENQNALTELCGGCRCLARGFGLHIPRLLTC